jgi:hypothetical protein
MSVEQVVQLSFAELSGWVGYFKIKEREEI